MRLGDAFRVMVLGAATLLATLALATPAPAADPGMQCQAAKLRSTGREVREHLRCLGLGAVGQQSPACFQSAAARRAKGFGRAEIRFTCLTHDDSGAIGDRVSVYAQTQLGALLPPGGLFGSLCTRAKLDAAGSRFEKVSKAYASDLVRPNPNRLAARIAKADARFLAAFSAADALANCQRTGDGPYELGRNDVWVLDFRRRLVPECGDGIRGGIEECDGADSPDCPGSCSAACTCAVCGNATKEPGEQCDGADDSFCPGACAADCTCPAPVCGDGVVGGAEECDASACYNDPSSFSCFPPGHVDECSCCALSICWVQDAGAFFPCCPGLTCYIDPMPAPHQLGYCVPQ
jgi:hypothetical protein